MNETQKAERIRAREVYEAALQDMHLAEKAFKTKQAAAQKALQEYNAHILGETK